MPANQAPEEVTTSSSRRSKMFGKPEWFQCKPAKLLLHPQTWQGWLYLAGWATVAGLPTLMLMSARLGPESMLWLIAATGTWYWDMRAIRKSLSPSVATDVLYIGDEEQTAVPSTRNFDLTLGR
jgi:hypothetical protein